MMKRMFLLALVLVTAVVVSAWRFRAGDASSTKMTVVERAETDVVTDTGDKGDTVGDILTFANKVYDEKNEKQIGTDNGYCFRTAVGEAWECTWTLKLDGGQITVQGPFLDQGDSMLAITGGTGDYMNAHGQMKLHARDDKGSAYDFTYEISQ
jgi:allene oxide cyclase